MEFKDARSERGQWRYRDGIVTFDVGRMTSGATNELGISVRPTVSGLLTNYVTLRSFNEESGALNDMLSVATCQSTRHQMLNINHRPFTRRRFGHLLLFAERNDQRDARGPSG